MANTYPQLTFAQRQELLKLLGQQPEANPTSASFEPDFFSKLMGAMQQPSPPMVQPQPQSDYVIVRSVENPSSIEVKDVTIGVKNVFPSTNGNEIYIKSWGKDGGINTDIFVKTNATSSGQEPVEDSIKDLKKRVKRLESTVSRLRKSPRNDAAEEEKTDG